MLQNRWRESAKKFREVRLAVGLKVGEVAEAAGLDRTTISTYEHLRARPSGDALQAWERALLWLTTERQRKAQLVLAEWEAR
jgi:transcriptional regulator with XRE-family HTH domain